MGYHPRINDFAFAYAFAISLNWVSHVFSEYLFWLFHLSGWKYLASFLYCMTISFLVAFIGRPSLVRADSFEWCVIGDITFSSKGIGVSMFDELDGVFWEFGLRWGVWYSYPFPVEVCGSFSDW